MKKIIAIVLVLAMLLGCGAVYAVNLPEYTLYTMQQEIQRDGLNAIEAHLTDDLQPMFHTVMGIVDQPWLTDLFRMDATQQLLSAMNSASSLNWKLGDVRHGRSTASVLLDVDSSAFSASISLEMVKQDGQWLIQSFTLPAVKLY